MKKLILLVLVVLLGIGFLSGVNATPAPIVIDFPNKVPITLERLPVKIIIPDPQAFGYPRVPTELKVSIYGFRNQGVIVPLLRGVDLNVPIEKEIELPLPVKKIGFYRVLVDVKCLYGPHYKRTYWYSYTANSPLEITNERIRIVSGPEVVQRGDKVYGRFYGYSFSQAIIYDWQKKGISFRFKIQVLDSQRNILYEEPAAVIGTCFDSRDFSDEYVFNEIKVLEQNYRFLLKQFPNSYLRVFYEIKSKGNWRYLFSVMPEEWVAKYGVVIEAALPQLQSGESFFTG